MAGPSNKSAREMAKLMRAIAGEKSTAERAFSKIPAAGQLQELEETVENIEVVVDDDIPPGAPTGLTVETASRALAITWDIPPHDDWVEFSRVEIKRVDTGVFVIYDTQDLSYVALGLDLTMYEVRVKHVDRWGLESQWSAPLTATPDRSVADDISDSLQINAERIFGELGVEQIPEITDASKLLTGVKNALTQAGQTEDRFINANLIAAWDVLAARAIISEGIIERAMVANAAISEAKIDSLAVTSAKIADLAVTSAKINSIAADKIIAGVLKAAISITSGGSISTGGALLDANGVTLSQTNTRVGFPSSAPGSYLTPRLTPEHLPSPFAGVGFFTHLDTQNPENSSRGVAINADGINGNNSWNGWVRFCATNGDQNNSAVTTSIVSLMSAAPGGRSRVQLSWDAGVNGNFEVLGALQLPVNSGARLTPQILAPAASVAANGGAYLIPCSVIPQYIFMQQLAGSAWYPMCHGVGSWTIYADGTYVRVINNATTARTVRCMILL